MLRSVRLTDETEKYIKEIQDYLKQKIGFDENLSDIIRISVIWYHDQILELNSNKLDNK